MGLLQNIFRNSKIPEYLLETLQYVPTSNSSFIEFYRVKPTTTTKKKFRKKKENKCFFIMIYFCFV